MQSIGVGMFLNMFEIHPETLSPFLTNEYTLEELEKDPW